MAKERNEQRVDGQRKLTPMQTLPVYHEFKKFRKYLFVAIERMPKWLKHSAGRDCEACVNICVRCLSVFSRTYNLRKEAARMLFDRFGRAIQFNEHYNKMIIVKSYV